MATHLTIVAVLQMDTYYGSLLHTSTRTKATCTNSAKCCTGDTLQPVLKSMQLLKAKLMGDAFSIAQLVEGQMQPSSADCVECSKRGLLNSVTTTDFRLSLPDVMPVMAGRERVSTLTAWTNAQAAVCLGLSFSVKLTLHSSLLMMLERTVSASYTPIAPVSCRLFTEHDPAVLAACVHRRTLDFDTTDNLYCLLSDGVG